MLLSDIVHRYVSIYICIAICIDVFMCTKINVWLLCCSKRNLLYNNFQCLFRYYQQCLLDKRHNNVSIVVCLYTDDCIDYTGTVMDDTVVVRQLVCCLGPQLFVLFFFKL